MNIEITLLIVLHSQEPGGMRMPGEPAITYNFLTCMLSGLTLLTRLQFHSHASQSHPARGTACMYGWDAQSTSAFARYAGLAVASLPIAFFDANESMGHPHIVAMLFARCVRWTVVLAWPAIA